MKRLLINEDGVASYIVASADPAKNVEAKTVSVDLNAVFGYNGLGDIAKKAIAFAVGHVLRNATAGKMDDVEKALEAVADRAKALNEGKWSERKETGETGESSASQLSQALAVVMGVKPNEAADFIVDQVRTALEEAGLDPDASNDDLSADEKSKRRKIAAKVRKSIGDDPAVSTEIGKIKLANAQKALEEKTKAAEGKASAFTKTEAPAA